MHKMSEFPEGEFLRLADAVTPTFSIPETMVDPKAMAKKLKGANKLIPPSIWRQLRRAFTPKGLPFFQFYIDLYRIRLGGPIDGDLKAQYKRAATRLNTVRSPVDRLPLSPAAVNHIALTKPVIFQVLNAVMQDRATPILWGKLNATLVPLLVDLARDKQVFMKPTRQTGRERWATFRKMSPKQEKVEKLRDDDPEAFALMQQLGQSMEQIDQGITDKLVEGGLEVQESFIAGRPVNVGHDPATGERVIYDRDGTRFVGEAPKQVGVKSNGKPKYDWSGTAEESFRNHQTAKKERMAELSRVPTRTQVKPQELRMISDERMEALVGDTEMDAITDDKAKQGRLTRMFPTKRMRRFINDPETGETRVEEFKVVTEGRYKGIFLDDLINSEGRLIEGTAYKYDVKKGKCSSVPMVMDPSEREPYITVADVVTRRQFQGKRIKVKTKKLYLKIDGTRQNKVLRDAIKALSCNTGKKSGCIPSVTYEAVKGSRAAGFYFDPKDFGIVMSSLKGMSLSSTALDEVKGYYKQLARAEAATKNLDAYEPDALASENEAGEKFQFITGSHAPHTGEWVPFGLREKQKEAVAWMDANGNSGVCALETGVGKTATSIAMMMKLVRDGLTDEGATYTKPDGKEVTTNGRFLFVCPKSLRGNIKKELKKILSDPKVMTDRLDVLTFAQFSGGSRSGTVPKQLRGVPFWKARIGQDGKRAGYNPVESYKGLRAHWEYNSRELRIYGVTNDEDQPVAELVFDRRTDTWEIRDQDTHKRIDTYTAKDDRVGVKRGLMTLVQRHKGRLAGAKVAKPKAKAKAWDPALYVSIFFDEAQALKNPSALMSQAALKLYHPRKICLTASPMERNPMEAYVLAAITNNTPLFGRSIEAKNNRKEMRRFKERFTEIVGGRIVGVKQDPLVQRDLHTWVKSNIFHADKTEVKEYHLPTPEITVTPVHMPDAVEGMYRDVAAQFSVIMKGAAAKFRDKKKGDNYADRQAERLFSLALRPVMKLLNDMANRPAKALDDIAFAVENGYLKDYKDKEGNPRPLPKPFMTALKRWQQQYTPEDLRGMAEDVGNPKIESAEAYLVSKLARAQGSRALLFADDKALCMEAGHHMAKTMPGTHIVALSNSIHFFRGSKELEKLVYPLDRTLLEKLVKDPEEVKRIMAETGGVSEHRLPFSKRSLRMHPALPAKRGTHDKYLADDWQQFVLKEIVSPDASIVSATLLGKSYMYGHNLQSFNTVIHLDRNNWNSESMKQRTARSWRAGQEEVVDEVTLDFTYAPDIEGVERDENDKTLDEIRASFQSMDAGIFDGIIKDAQGIELGEEWESIDKKDASLWNLDEKVIEMMASPFIGRANAPGTS